MIRIHKFQKKGVTSGSIDDLGGISKCWAECINPSQKELNELSEKGDIPLNDLKEVLDKEERPKIYDIDNYSIIIVRAPYATHKSIRTTPVSIFISKNKNNIITITLREVESIGKIVQLIKEGKVDPYENGISFITYKILDDIFNNYFSIMDVLEDKIDKIENTVVNSPEKMTAHDIFLVKKTLIYFQKALTANREVVVAIEKDYATHIDKKNSKRFRIIYNDVAQLIDMVGTYRDIITGTLDIYLSAVSNNLNKVVKTLTIGASFILIPTLISGIYGMNFSNNSNFNMPELYWQYGYFFALGLMVFSVVASYWFFKKKGWL